MSRSKESLVMVEARRILEEVTKTTMLTVDQIKFDQLQVFLAHKLLIVYHEGFADGMRRARNILKGKEGESYDNLRTSKEV